MKKMIIACAVLLAGVLSSCGDTNYCYEITTTFTILNSTTTNITYTWGTSNELDAAIAEAKASCEKLGLSEDAYSVTYKRTSKSESDCRK